MSSIMKSFLDYIIEYKGHAIRDKEKSIGDPDEIQHFFGQGWVKLKFNKDNAYPFVYNKKLDKIIFGRANSIHNNIFTTNNTDKLKEMGLDGVDNVRQLRYCCGMDDDTEEIDRWYEENKKYIDETVCGRIWYNAQDDFESWDSEEEAEQMAKLFGDLKDLDSSKCYVANWNEVAPNEFKKVLDNIVKHFSKEHNKKIKSYIAIDNNGEPIELEVGNDAVKIDKRSSEHEKEIEHAWQYHTDTSAHGRAKKRELTSGWIKSRNEHSQKEQYNKTSSKTAAEWHTNKTQRYNSKTGKMEWGEKIGDSLQMKSLNQYITEFIVKKHIDYEYGYDLYEYDNDSYDKPVFVCLDTIEQIEAFNNFKHKDDTYNTDKIKQTNEWVAVWPTSHGVNSTRMDRKYLEDETLYKKVGTIDSLDDITIEYYKKHNLNIP